MKYNLSAKSYQLIFLVLLKKYYKNNLPTRNFNEIKKKIKKYYREMVERTPGIGGNSLESNLVAGCFFFAMAKADEEMTLELMNDIIDQSIQSNLMQKAHEGQKKKGTIFSDKVQDQKVLESQKSKNSKYETDWVFDYQKGKQEFYCTYTKCGLCTLAKKEHMERYLPCLCRMDYQTYEMVGAKLIRNHTLAKGDSCCDFHVVRKKDI